jgi:hypothetical protein
VISIKNISINLFKKIIGLKNNKGQFIFENINILTIISKSNESKRSFLALLITELLLIKWPESKLVARPVFGVL